MNLTLFSPRSAASSVPRCTCLCDSVMPARASDAGGSVTMQGRVERRLECLQDSGYACRTTDELIMQGWQHKQRTTVGGTVCW